MPRIERRNLYRLLFVQPEAPPAVLKASYRALMSSTRLHPDLGGTHEQAAQLNAAYAVLSDPQQRALYDAAMRRRHPGWPALRAQRPARSAPSAATVSSGGPTPSAPTRASTVPDPQDPRLWREQHRCPLCHVPFTLLVPRNPRCLRCDSPLTPAPSTDMADREMLGRRQAERYARPQDAHLRLTEKPETFSARVKDLSMCGLSLLVRAPLQMGQAFRVQTGGFDAVAQVVSMRPLGARLAVHARLLTLQVIRQARGTLLDTQA